MENYRYSSTLGETTAQDLKAQINHPEYGFYFQHALDAWQIADAASREKPGVGCMASSITFTHGIEIYRKIGKPASYNTGGVMMILLGYRVARLAKQESSFMETPSLSPSQLHNFLSEYPTAWVGTHYSEHSGHMMGIVTQPKGGYVVWDVIGDYNKTIATHHRGHPLQFLNSLNSLLGRIKIHHPYRLETPIAFHGFRDM